MNLKNENGITLVALIITIIILVILAGVTIMLGITTIINNSKNGVNEYNKGQENEVTALDEMHIALRRIMGQGEKRYEITDDTLPEFITESNLENVVEDKKDNYNVTFKNYDSDIEGKIYNPPQYKLLKKDNTIKVKIEDDYKMYIYACANSNEDGKGNITVKNKSNEQIETTYALKNRKNENTEPLQVELKTGEYEIQTSYDTWLFKIQLDPIVIHDENTTKEENKEEEKTEIVWDTPTNIPTWLSIMGDTSLREGDIPFADTSIKNAIKFKEGFTINLGEKKYNIELYITGDNKERKLTLNEDSSFSEKLKPRDAQKQEPIKLYNKTGTLNFKVDNTSQLYKIVLTEVKE